MVVRVYCPLSFFTIAAADTFRGCWEAFWLSAVTVRRYCPLSALMQYPPTIRKEPADKHTFGPDMTLHGSVYCAYDGTRLVCYAATAGEARRLYRKALQRFHEAKQAGR